MLDFKLKDINNPFKTREGETIIDLDKYVEVLKENEELKSDKVQKIKNERGAGRKSRFKDEDIEIIKNLRNEGKSYKAIAEEMNCSVGLVHKLINEK